MRMYVRTYVRTYGIYARTYAPLRTYVPLRTYICVQVRTYVPTHEYVRTTPGVLYSRQLTTFDSNSHQSVRITTTMTASHRMELQYSTTTIYLFRGTEVSDSRDPDCQCFTSVSHILIEIWRNWLEESGRRRIIWLKTRFTDPREISQTVNLIIKSHVRHSWPNHLRNILRIGQRNIDFKILVSFVSFILFIWYADIPLTNKLGTLWYADIPLTDKLGTLWYADIPLTGKLTHQLFRRDLSGLKGKEDKKAVCVIFYHFSFLAQRNRLSCLSLQRF